MPSPSSRPPAARGFARMPLLAFLAAVGLLALLPLWLRNPYGLHVMVLLFLAVIQGAGWNILGGYTGQYSVGHAAFFGIGAYATLMLLQFRQVPPWWGVWAAVALAVVVGVAIGSITFRLRGPYFVLASIAVAEILRLIALNWKDFTNGAEGILVTDMPALKVGGRVVTDFLTKVPFYYAALALAAVTICANWVVQHSKLGYYFQAIREDQDAAHSLGIPLALYKNVALAISAVFTSLAGAFFAVYVGFIDPGSVLSVETSVQMVLICIIGGIGTIYGPVVGSLVVVPLSELLRANFGQVHALVYGVLVVLVILFMPDGILGWIRSVTRRRPVEPATGAAR
jgi:branched-chain amino acid transport system permease protein